jgi:hypothetical protein
MRWHLITALAVVLTGASPSAPARDPDLLEVIPQLLAKIEGLEHHGFRARHLKDGWAVHYCPDNTCDVIRAPTGVPRQVIGDFSLLWLYYVSSYIYLKRFYETDARPFVIGVMERRAGNCPTQPEYARASCVLTSMANEFNIRLGFRRSDEGATVENRLDAKDELSAANIARVKEWQLEQWRR